MTTLDQVRTRGEENEEQQVLQWLQGMEDRRRNLLRKVTEVEEMQGIVADALDGDSPACALRHVEKFRKEEHRDKDDRY